eukprot:3934577-Alexandrium_andersonii.AAC.1
MRAPHARASWQQRQRMMPWRPPWSSGASVPPAAGLPRPRRPPPPRTPRQQGRARSVAPTPQHPCRPRHLLSPRSLGPP